MRTYILKGVYKRGECESFSHFTPHPIGGLILTYVPVLIVI